MLKGGMPRQRGKKISRKGAKTQSLGKEKKNWSEAQEWQGEAFDRAYAEVFLSRYTMFEDEDDWVTARKVEYQLQRFPRD
jgi:hypothetical protein